MATSEAPLGSHPPGRAHCGDVDGLWPGAPSGRVSVHLRAQIFVNGDGVGRLRWFEYRGGAWAGHDLLGEDVIHGHSLQLEDINRDGHLDPFCAEMAQRTDSAKRPDHPNARMWIFYGDGGGNFTTRLVAAGVDNHESRVADLDGDGDSDIVSKPYISNTPRLDVWLNGGTGPREATKRRYGFGYKSRSQSSNSNKVAVLKQAGSEPRDVREVETSKRDAAPSAC